MIADGRPTRGLVLVPGILDSQLWDRENGTRLWPPVGWQEEGRFNARSLKLLVTVEQKAALLLFPTLYDELLWAFHAMGYHEDERLGAPRNLWVFVYDWTRSNRDSGRALANFIKEEVLATHNRLHPEDLWEDVDVVSHSMGGLVTRAAATLFQAPIQRAVYVATPHFGAPLAYFALHPGIGLTPALGYLISVVGRAMWEWRLRLPGDELRLEKQLHWVVTRLPSVYEMLPDEFYLTEERSLVVIRTGLRSTPVVGAPATYWEHRASRFQDSDQCRRAEEAMSFKRDLGRRVPGKSLVIYSDTEVTPDQVGCWWNRFGRPYDSGQRGDESVPVLSASAELGDAVSVTGTHEGVPNSREVHRLIAEYLGSGVPAFGRSALPIPGDEFARSVPSVRSDRTT